MTTADLHWLAGVLEGEGCFGGYWRGPYFQPMISLQMTDRDVVDRAADLLGCARPQRSCDARGRKPMWRCGVQNRRAVNWMADLHALMGVRRQSKIGAVLAQYADYRPPVRSSGVWRRSQS